MSCIDHFLVNARVFDLMSIMRVSNDPMNCSSHQAVMMCFNESLDELCDAHTIPHAA